MHVRRSLAATALVPLLLGFVLSGCQEADPEPKMPETADSSASPTETAAAEQESPEEFIRRWVAASDRYQMSGDGAEYKAMSRGCAPCHGLVKTVEEAYRSGGSIMFDGSVVTGLERVAKQPPTFDLTLNVADTVVLDAAGQQESSYPAGIAKYRVFLNRRGAVWNVHYAGRR